MLDTDPQTRATKRHVQAPPTGKIALVTGAGRGLGRAIAQRLAADGHQVIVNYNASADPAATLVEEIAALGGKAIALQGDVSTSAGIRRLFENLTEQLGPAARLDHLICNAGIIRAATMTETSEADFDALFDVNVKGVFFTIQAALPLLQRGGTIVTLGSGLTRFSYPQYTAYAASKGAVGTLTQGLAKDLGPKGITVNMVAPGPVDTDLNADWLRNPDAQNAIAAETALGRIAVPQDVEGIVSFLCSDDSRWITGQRIEVSGGIHL